jgi:hypothetical protein
LPDKCSLSLILVVKSITWSRYIVVTFLLFTDRAIKYRHDMGFTKLDIAISVGTTDGSKW